MNSLDNFENSNKPVEQPIPVGDWVLNILILAIPLVNIIMLFVWAFGSDTPTTKANWAKAHLIWIAIAFLLTFLFFAIFGTAILMGAGESGF